MRQRKRRTRNFVIFDIDVDAIAAGYAARYVGDAHDHEKLTDFCEQVELDLQIPGTKELVRAEILKLQRLQIA